VTIWIDKDLEALDIVIERSSVGVATVLADSVDHLLRILTLCPEEPFRTTGGAFTFGVHVPMKNLKVSQYSKMLEKENAEFLAHDVSPAPHLFRWIALRPTEIDIDASVESGVDPDDVWYENGEGYIWADDTDLIIRAFETDGWEHVALVPCFLEPKGLELTQKIGGVIDSFTLEIEEVESPPTFDDLFGGDA